MQSITALSRGATDPVIDINGYSRHKSFLRHWLAIAIC